MSTPSQRRNLASEYRPKQFEGLQGILAQEHVTMVLKDQVQSGRLANAYLFTGTRGVGKTTAARVLAMALNCDAPKSGEPCTECSTCKAIVDGRTTMDVTEMDAATNRGVDDARELREKLMYAASEPGKHKVYIIDEAHMLTREAWNTLLKTLEEPPPQVVFVFATTEPKKIEQAAPPILSRCQRFDFRAIQQDDIAAQLGRITEAEGIRISDEAQHLLARRGRGSMRDALTALDQVSSFHFARGEEITGETVRQVFNEPDEKVVLAALQVFAQAGLHEDPKRARRRALEGIEYCTRNGIDFVEFFRSVRGGLYDLYKVKAGLPVEGWSESGLESLSRVEKHIEFDEIQVCMHHGQEVSGMMREGAASEDPQHALALFLLGGIDAVEKRRLERRKDSLAETAEGLRPSAAPKGRTQQ